MRGKEKCRILKQIRAEIAAQNDIDLVIEECTHKGECRGTCPRCESEVRYLERELEKRRALRQSVALAGVCAGMTLALSGCAMVEAVMDAIKPPVLQPTGLVPAITDPPIEDLRGDVPSVEVLEGEVAWEDEAELSGANEAAEGLDASPADGQEAATDGE